MATPHGGEVLFDGAEKQVQNMQPTSPDDTNWDLFDPIAYIGHNYVASVLPEDHKVIDRIIERIEELQISPRSMQRVLNVGHGSVFAADAVIQHLVHDKGTLELVEYGQLNLAHMHATIARGLQGDKSIWHKFEKHASFKSPVYKDGLERVWQLSRVIPGSIYDLAKASYDAAFTFYCPESITSEVAEFEQAVHSFVGSVKKDGLVVMAFIRGSEGYDTPGRIFPAVSIDCEDVHALLKNKLRDLEIINISSSPAFRHDTGPQASGIGLATGIRR